MVESLRMIRRMRKMMPIIKPAGDDSLSPAIMVEFELCCLQLTLESFHMKVSMQLQRWLMLVGIVQGSIEQSRQEQSDKSAFHWKGSLQEQRAGLPKLILLQVLQTQEQSSWQLREKGSKTYWQGHLHGEATVSRHYDLLQVCFEESNSFPSLQVHVVEKGKVLLTVPETLEQLKVRVKVLRVIDESLSLARMQISWFCLLELMARICDGKVTLCGLADRESLQIQTSWSAEAQERIQLLSLTKCREIPDEDWLVYEISTRFGRLRVISCGIRVVIESCAKNAQPLPKAMLPILHWGIEALAVSWGSLAAMEQAQSLQSQEDVMRSWEAGSRKQASEGQGQVLLTRLGMNAALWGEQACSFEWLAQQMSLQSGEQTSGPSWFYSCDFIIASIAPFPSFTLIFTNEVVFAAKINASLRSNSTDLASNLSCQSIVLFAASKIVMLLCDRRAIYFSEGETTMEQSLGKGSMREALAMVC